MSLQKRIEQAVWEGDESTLQDLAPCRCCCDEHTFGYGCPAYAWGGCRGQGMAEWPAEEEAWVRHYAKAHGMSRDQFYGVTPP